MSNEFETMNLDSLADKTVFLSLKFGVFGNSRKADIELGSDADTTESRFKHQKLLLDSPELKAVSRGDFAIKTLVSALCLPSKDYDVGIRIAPLGNVKKIYALLKEYSTVSRPALVDAFLAVYENQVQAAKLDLGPKHFNPLQYPSLEDVKEEFSFRYRFVSFGVPSKLAEFAPDEYAAETQKAHAFLMEAAQGVVVAMRATAHGLVQKLADSLSAEKTVDGKQKKFYASHVDNLKEFINGFDIRNVANDTELKNEMKKLELLMQGVDVEIIRHNDGLKLDLQAKVSQIAATMGSLAETKGRKFRDAPVIEGDTQTATVADVKEAAAKVSSITGVDILIPSDETIEKVLAGQN